MNKESGVINITPMNAHQTIDGFGAGIKRRTEDLYELDDNLRNQNMYFSYYAEFYKLKGNSVRVCKIKF